MPIIPPIWKMEVRGQQFEDSPSKTMKPYLKNKLKILAKKSC
jgi:hypothetical protein